MRLLELACLLTLLCACSSGGGGVAGAHPGTVLSSQGRTHLGLAQGYMASGNLEKAAERADMALSSDPDSGEVHALLALLASSAGDDAKATKEFDRALRLAPGDGGILNAHASWLCERGDAVRADAEFNLALRDARYRTPVQALVNAGKCARNAGQWSSAEGYLRRALAILPRDPQVLYLLADVALKQRTILEAQAFIQRRDALGADGATLELAARIEDADGNRLSAAKYRQRLKNEFPNYVPTGEGVARP